MNISETGQEERTYQIVQELGHGAQGSVYLVRDIVTKQIYAAKVVRLFS
jgi:serine/threonine protein kinase